MTATEDEQARAVPQGGSEIAAAAAAIGLVIPADCMAGVVANLDLLRRHAGTLAGPPVPGR